MSIFIKRKKLQLKNFSLSKVQVYQSDFSIFSAETMKFALNSQKLIFGVSLQVILVFIDMGCEKKIVGQKIGPVDSRRYYIGLLFSQQKLSVTKWGFYSSRLAVVWAIHDSRPAIFWSIYDSELATVWAIHDSRFRLCIARSCTKFFMINMKPYYA